MYDWAKTLLEFRNPTAKVHLRHENMAGFEYSSTALKINRESNGYNCGRRLVFLLNKSRFKPESF